MPRNKNDYSGPRQRLVHALADYALNAPGELRTRKAALELLIELGGEYAEEQGLIAPSKAKAGRVPRPRGGRAVEAAKPPRSGRPGRPGRPARAVSARRAELADDDNVTPESRAPDRPRRRQGRERSSASSHAAEEVPVVKAVPPRVRRKSELNGQLELGAVVPPPSKSAFDVMLEEARRKLGARD